MRTRLGLHVQDTVQYKHGTIAASFSFSLFQIPTRLTTQTAICQDNKMVQQVHFFAPLSSRWSDLEGDVPNGLTQSDLLKHVVPEKQTSAWIQHISNVLFSSKDSLQDADCNVLVRRYRQSEQDINQATLSPKNVARLVPRSKERVLLSSTHESCL
jgi:hypothetical protein